MMIRNQLIKYCLSIILVLVGVGAIAQPKSSSPLIITKWWPFESEFSDKIHNLYFRVYNNSSKTIKYITIYTKAFNRVGDAIKDNKTGKFVNDVKIVGPIDPKTYGEVIFDNVWYSSVLDRSEITQVIVIFMDNTSKTLKNIDQIVDNRFDYYIENNKKSESKNPLTHRFSEEELKDMSIIKVTSPINLNHLASELNEDIKKISRWNYDYDQSLTRYKDGTSKFILIRIPKEKLELFLEKKAIIENKL